MANHHASGPRAWLLGSTALLPVAFAAGPVLAQSPTGGQVVGGSATISQTGNTTVITQSTNRGAINWQQFDVGRNQAVQFQQPNAGSWTLNRVTGPNPSSIAGSITANGGIAIVNPSGVVFAGTAQVNVANLIASTAGISNENFMAGRMLFDQPGRPGARVENHGSITVADRGMAALVAPGVSNTGTIRARLGRVALQGAEAFALDLNGDGLLSIDVTQAVRTAPTGATALVTNSGTIDAPGGSVLISAHAASGLVEDLVRHTGRVVADTVGTQAGQVAITATGGGVRVDGAVSAVGAAANQRGGSIALRGSTATRVTSTARIDASGGAGGGTVLVGTTGVGRNQTMSATTTIERGATFRADATASGTGGTIAVNASDRSDIEAAFSARGGPTGGDGGFIELSGQGSMRLNAGLDLAAPAGRAGTFLLDPRNIRVVEDADMPADTAGAVAVGGAGSDINGNPGATVTASTGGNGSVLFIQASKLNALGAGAIQLEATKDISIQGAIARPGDTLRLFADGAIDQSGTGTITAGTLVIRAFNGTGSAASATLGLANAIGVLDAKVAGGLTLNNFETALSVTNAVGSSVVLFTTKALTLNGAVGASGASVTLRADDAISQSSGAVTASSLRIRAGDDAGAAASAVLSKTNAVTTLNALATGALTLNNGTTALGVTNATGSAVTLTSTKALTLNGAVGLAGGTVALNTDAAITQSTAGITTGTLTIRGSDGAASGLSAVLSQANAIDVLNAKVSGTLTVNNFTTALSVANAVGSDVTLFLTKDIALNGAVGASGGTVTLRSDGAISQTGGGGITATTLRIRAGDNVGAITKVVLDQTNIVGSLDALATGAVTLNNGSTALSVTRAVGDAVTLITTKTLALTGTVGAGDGFVTLRADGAITQSGSGAVATTTLTIRGADGTAAAPSAVLGKTNNVAALDALATGTLTFDNGSRALNVNNATGSAVTLITSSSIALKGAVGGSGATVTLRATNGVTQTADGVTADTLTIRAQNGTASTTFVDMAKANAVGTLDALSSGELTLDNGSTNLSVTNAVGDAVTLITKGNLALGGDVGAAAASVTLRADGDITQSAGLITGTTLRIRGADDAAGAGSASLGLANDVAVLDAEATGALSFTAAGSFAVTRAAGSSVTLVSPNTLSITDSGSGGGGIEASGDIGLSGDALTISTVTGTNGDAAIRSTGGSGTISLRSDGITGSGLVSATLTGTVEIGANTAARPTAIITGINPGALVLSPTPLTTQMETGTLRLGETTIAGVTRRGGALTVTDALAPTALQVKSGIELVAGGDVAFGSTFGRTGLGLSVHTSGAITQGPAAAITAGTLTIRGVAGGTTGSDAVTLDTAGNQLGGLDAISIKGIAVRSTATTDLAVAQARSTGSSQSIVLTGAGGAALSGDVGGTNATVGLNFSGGIGQSAGAITAATLTVRDFTGGTTLVGKVALDQANAVGKINIAAGAGLSFNNGSTDLTVTRASTATGAVTTSLTTTGKLSIGTDLGTDSSAIVALNVTGSISQTTGVITASTLTIRGGAGGSTGAGTVVLSKLNAVATLDGISTAGLTLNNGTTNLSVARAQGTAVTLTTTGTLAAKGAIGGTGATVGLNVDGAITQSNGAITAASLTIRDATTGTSGPAGVALTQTNAVGKLDAISTGDLTFVNDTMALTATRATAGAGQAVALTGQGDVILGTVGGAGVNTITLTVAGDLSQGTGGITGDTLIIRGTGGGSSGPTNVILGETSNAIATLDAISTGALTYTNSNVLPVLTVARATTGAGQAVSITGGGAVLLAGDVGGTATTDVSFFVAGGLSQSLGTITADTLSITNVDGTGSAGSVSLALANDVARLDAKSTGALSFNNGATDLSVLRATSTATTTLTSTGALDLAGAVGGTGGNVLLRADGAVTQSASGITASSLTVSNAAGGGTAASIDLMKANTIGILTARATGAVAVNATTDLAVLRAAGSTVGLTAGGVLTVVDSAFGGLGLQAETSVALTAGSLSIGTGPFSNGSAAIRATDAAGKVSLRTDTMNWTGLVSAPALVEIGPLLASTPIIVTSAAPTPGTMTINPGLLTSARVQTATLRIGSTTIDGTTVLGNGITVNTALSPTGTAVTNRLQLAAGGTGAITINAAVGRTDLALDLLSPGDISQGFFGPISASTLFIAADAAATAGAGVVSLANGSNAIASVQALGTQILGLTSGTDLSVLGFTSGAGQAVTLTSSGKLDLAGDVGGSGTSTLNINVALGLTQSGGTITTKALTIRGATGGSSGAGSVALDQTNSTGSLDAIATGSLSYVNGKGDLSVAQALAGVGQTATLTTGGNLDIAGNVGGTGTTSVALNVPGALSQSGGVITAGTLTIRDSAGGSSGPAGVDLGKANAVTSLDAISTAGVTFANGAVNLSVTQALGAAGQSVTLTSGAGLDLAGTIGGTTTTAVVLNAVGGIGQSNGAITASSLTIRDSAGGSSGAAGIALDRTNTVATLDAISTKALSFTNDTTDLSVTQALAGAGQSLTLSTGGKIDLAGKLGGTATTAVRLNLPGALTQSGGIVTAVSLTIRDAAAGTSGPAGIALAKSNAVGSLDAISTKDLTFTNGATDLSVALATAAAGQKVTLTTGGALDLAGNVGGTATTLVALNAAGALTQSGGVVTAGSLTIRDAAGGSSGPAGVALGKSNAVGSLNAISTKDLLFTNGATDLGVVLATAAAGQKVTLTSGAALDLAGNIGGTATTSVALNAAGALTQSGGTLTAGSLTIRDSAGGASGPAGVTLDMSNDVASLNAISTKDLSFTNGATALTVAQATAAAGRTVTLTGGAALDLAGPVGGTATTLVALNAAGALTQSGGVVTGGSLTIRDAAGGISGPAGVALGKSNTVGSLDAISTKDLIFANGAADLTVALASAGAGQQVTLSSGAALDLAGNVGGTATTSVTLNAAGALTQSGGTLTAASLTIRDSAGGISGPAGVSLDRTNAVAGLDAISTKDLSFTNGATDLAVTQARAAAGSTVTLTGGAKFDLAGTIGGTTTTTVVLNAVGGIGQSNGAITASSLTIRDSAGGSSGAAGIALDRTNTVATLDAISTKALSFTNDTTDLSVTQALAGAGQSLTLSTGGKIDLAGKLGGTATTAVRLNLPGALTQSGGIVTAVSLTIRDAVAGTSGPAGIALAKSNAVGSLDAISTKDLLFTNGATDLSVALATAAAGQKVTLTTGGALDLAGNVGGTATTLVALNAAGALTQSGGVVTAGSLTIRDAAGGSSGPAGVALGKSNAVGSLNAISTKDLLFTNGATDLGVVLATAAAGQKVTLTSGAALDLAGNIGGTATTQVLLHAGGPVTQTSGVITAESLIVLDAPGGSSGPAGVKLGLTNAVGNIDIVSTKALLFLNGPGDVVITRAITGTGQAVTITGGGKLDLAGDVGGSGTTVGLFSLGALSQSGGSVTADTLTIRDGLGGSSGPAGIALTRTNAVGSLDAVSTKDLSFINGATDLSLAQATAGTGRAVTVTTGAKLDLAGAVGGAATIVTLNAPGAVTQSGGTITAASLTLRDSDGGTSGPASILLDRANLVGSLDAIATGSLGFANGALNLSVAQAVGNAVALTGGAAIDLAGAVGRSGTTNVTVTANGASGAITQSGGIVTAGTLNVSGPAAMTLGRDNKLGAIEANATAGDITITTVLGANVAASTGAGTVTLTGDSLTIATVGATSGIAANAVVLSATGGSIGQSQAITGVGAGASTALTANAADAVSLNNPANRIASVTGGATAGFDLVTASALDAGSIIAGSIGLTATSIAVTGTLAAPTIGLTATTGALTQGASGLLVGAGSGATGLTAVSATTTTLTAAGNRIDDATLKAGSLASPADAALTSAVGLTLRTASLGAGTSPVANAGARNLTVIAPSLTLGGVRTTGGLTATTTAAIGQTAGLATGGLLTLSAGGSVTLDRTDNAFSDLGVIFAGGTSVLRTASSLFATDTITVTNGLTLQSAGDITILASGTTQVFGTSGVLIADGAISVRGSVTAATGLTMTSGGAMTVDAGQLRAIAGDAMLTAGGAISLTSGGAVRAGGLASLQSGGSLSATSATVAGGIATLTAGSGLTLTGSAVQAGSGGATLVAQGGGLTLASSAVAAAGVASLQASAGVSLGTSSSVTGASVQATAGTDLSIGAASLVATAGNAALVATTGAVTLGGASGTTATVQAAGQASLQSATSVTIGTGGGVASLAGSAARVVAGSSLAIGNTGRVQAASGDATLIAGTTIGVTGGSGASASGTLGLQAGGAVTLAATASGGTVLTGGAVNVTAGGGIDLATGVVRATGGTVTLAANGGGLTLRLGGAVAASDHVRVTAAGDIGLTSATVTAGGDATLTTAGNLTLTSSNATTASGSLRFSASGSAIFQSSTLSGQGGVNVTTGGAISANALTVAANGGDARFSAGASAGFTASRISARDTISVSAAASMAFTDTVIDPTTVLLTAAGDFTANGLTGQSSGLFRIAAGGQVILTTSAFTADVFEVVAGAPNGQMTLSGVSIAVDTGALLAAPGGVFMTGLVTVKPGATGRYAPLVIDTRRGADAYTAFPTAALPDTPGTQPADQATQVATRLTPVSAFSPVANAEPGGDVLLNLAATNLPVFLLLNGGSATGALDAGRLGIHGTGGKVELSGRLGQFEGSAAASQASLSTVVEGAFAPGTQQNYRFNSCTIGAFTCNVLAVLTPIPPPTTQSAELRIAANPRDPDALLPNIAEEDY